MPRQQNETECPRCGERITYSATPSSAPDLGRFIAIEDVKRDCRRSCTIRDEAMLEHLEMQAVERYHERDV